MGRFRAMEKLRVTTAEKTAREMIAKGDRSPEACRLLAQVLEVQAYLGDRKALDGAAAEYERVPQARPAEHRRGRAAGADLPATRSG